jgi:hypothetical protein
MQPAALIVTIPLMMVLTLAAAGYWFAAAQTPQPSCGDATMQDQVRGAMYLALDDALRQHIASLYAIMLKEYGRSSAVRAKAGVNLAIDAYLHGYKAVEAWRLPPCR